MMTYFRNFSHFYTHPISLYSLLHQRFLSFRKILRIGMTNLRYTFFTSKITVESWSLVTVIGEQKCLFRIFLIILLNQQF